MVPNANTTVTSTHYRDSFFYVFASLLEWTFSIVLYGSCY